MADFVLVVFDVSELTYVTGVTELRCYVAVTADIGEALVVLDKTENINN